MKPIESVIKPYIPKSWAELSDKELRLVFKLMQFSPSPDHLAVSCFIKFNGIRILKNDTDVVHVLWKGKRLLIDKAQFIAAVNKLRWITEPPKKPVFFHKFRLKRNINAYLHSLTFGQWLTADNYYIGYLCTNVEKNIELCLAALLSLPRPPKLQDWERTAAIFWMVGMKTHLASLYPAVFPVSTNKETLTPAQLATQTRKNTDDILRALSKADITKYDAVLECNIYTAFAELDALTRESIELEKLQKQKK